MTTGNKLNVGSTLPYFQQAAYPSRSFLVLT
jgi:hypothetical protein